jgi:hypothetical protein
MWFDRRASELLAVEEGLRAVAADAAVWVQDTTAYVKVSYSTA